jgi:hypothetical protein
LGTYDLEEHAAIAANMGYKALGLNEDLVIFNEVPKEYYKTFKPSKALLKLIESKKKQITN